MELLTEEEVMHVAALAKIDVTEEEMKMYRESLSSLLKEVDKIKTIGGYDDEMLITPVSHQTVPREDVTKETLSFAEVKKNAPKTSGNYIEVPVMIHE